MRVTFAQRAEVDQFEQFVGDLLEAGVFANAEADVFRDTQVREQRVVLKDHADPALLGRQGEAWARDHFASQRDFTFIHRLKTGDGSQCGGLAAP